MMTVARMTLLVRMPASTVNQGEAPTEASVEPSAIPEMELKPIAPWNSYPKALAARPSNRAMRMPVAATVPSMPNSWERRTRLTSPPSPIDCTAPSRGSSGKTRNLIEVPRLKLPVT
jgi:hypothetical protein